MIIYIPGDPVGKERPRHTRNGHTYTPEKTKAYESKVAWAWKQAGGPKLDGPVLMRIVWHYPIPKRTAKANRAAIRRYAEESGVFVEVDNERLHSDDLPR